MMKKLSYISILETVDHFQTAECADLKWRIKAGYDFEVNKANARLQFINIPSFNSPYMFGFGKLEEDRVSVYVYLVMEKLVFVAIDDVTYEILDCSVMPISYVYSLTIELHAVAGVESSIINAFVCNMILQDKHNYIYRLPTSLEIQKGELNKDENLDHCDS